MLYSALHPTFCDRVTQICDSLAPLAPFAQVAFPALIASPPSLIAGWALGIDVHRNFDNRHWAIDLIETLAPAAIAITIPPCFLRFALCMPERYQSFYRWRQVFMYSSLLVLHYTAFSLGALGYVTSIGLVDMTEKIRKVIA